MKRIIFLLLFIFSLIPSFAQWKPAGDKLKTAWAEKIDVNNVLPEYPRPILERTEWANLNGLWNYVLVMAGLDQPVDFDGKILVPFPVESSLSGVQKMAVKVWDGTDKGFQPRGKQTSEPRSIWYTPVTGIWQTVWIEPVSKKHIENIWIVPNIDKNQVSIQVESIAATFADVVEVKIFDGKNVVASSKASSTEKLDISIPEAKLWSPESPFLYTMKVSLHSSGLSVDQVSSYFAMRKISTKRDINGIVRLELNNKPYFQFGPLDQGWWPDGLYTAPTDEALKYDIQKIKDFGFNMIRKHVKAEPARWYTHCDQLGILVWQDMPSGDRSPQWQSQNYLSRS